jgi:hypothetical protein
LPKKAAEVVITRRKTVLAASHGRGPGPGGEERNQGVARRAQWQGRWSPRRTLAFVLMISGVIWVVLGLAVRVVFAKYF